MWFWGKEQQSWVNISQIILQPKSLSFSWSLSASVGCLSLLPDTNINKAFSFLVWLLDPCWFFLSYSIPCLLVLPLIDSKLGSVSNNCSKSFSLLIMYFEWSNYFKFSDRMQWTKLLSENENSIHTFPNYN